MAVTITPNNIVTFAANGDVLYPAASAYKPNNTIRYIWIANPAASKFYKLRHKNASGSVVWQYGPNAAPDALFWTEHPMSLGGGLWLETDDTVGPTFTIFVNLCG